MHKEMDTDGQMNLDTRADAEKEVDRLSAAALDAARIARIKAVSGVRIKNRHEGYGFLADAHQPLLRGMKMVKDGMNDLLEALPHGDKEAVDKAYAVSTALSITIEAALYMAAEARRMADDLCDEAWAAEPGDDQDDGFEDV